MKYILTLFIMFLPLLAYCDRFVVANDLNVNNEINKIESCGGRVEDVKVSHSKDGVASYVIKYISGQDLQNQFKAWDNIVKGIK